jgi:AcrR family transcriptional regulator
MTLVVNRLWSDADKIQLMTNVIGRLLSRGDAGARIRSMTATAATHPPQAGRRERKKQRTREALIDAAFTLFAEKGFEPTTVEEIADTVDVSSRTFFRYFSSKEDVVLTYQEEQFEALLEALAARPAEEPVVTAMRRAVVSVIHACEEGEYGFDPAKFSCIQQLLKSSPAVFSRALEYGQKKHMVITKLIADRMGVDPEKDMRPHVAAATVSCTFQAAFEVWVNGGTKAKSFSDLLDQVFAILEDGINYPSKTGPAG